MLKKLGLSLLSVLIVVIVIALYIEKVDQEQLESIESELRVLQLLNEQVHLNTETVIAFSEGEVTEDAVEVSVQALLNSRALYLVHIYYSLEAGEKESVKEISSFWSIYWEKTTFADTISDRDIAVLRTYEASMLEIEESLSEEVNKLRDKQANYWWSGSK